MQYMNGHAPQIGDSIEVPSTGQRLTVTAIPQAGIVRCGQSNLRSQGCTLLSRGNGMQGGNSQGMRPDNLGYGGGYGGGGYGQGGYVDPGLGLVEDLIIMDTMMDVVTDVFDIAADIAIMDDFGGGW